MTAPPRESAAVVPGRVLPLVSPGPLVPVADFGPLDTARGWIVTGVITVLAAVTRF